jgi:hypothetical protein
MALSAGAQLNTPSCGSTTDQFILISIALIVGLAKFLAL